MKEVFPIAVLMLLLSVSAGETGEASADRILAIVANSNFRDEELLVPKRLFEKEGFKVVIASSSKDVCTGMLGATVSPDLTIDEVNVDDYDAIVFVGGPGSSEYWDNPVAHAIARNAVKKDKVLAAICIAPVTLANAGVLSKKKATVWSSEADSLRAKGAYYTGSSVESDQNIITANGPSAAGEFAKAVLKAVGRK